jgi:ParB family chromosome partitioning protein
VEAAREVMGEIDLDPASSKEANGIIKAKRFYSIKEDGLKKKWIGHVWMNPPYEQPMVRLFCEKLVNHFDSNEVTEAIILVNNATETDWWQNIACNSSAMCTPNGRIKFWHPRKESVPLQGQSILYLGKNRRIFAKSFNKFGIVWYRE